MDIDPTIREAVIAAGTMYIGTIGLFIRWATAPVVAAYRMGRRSGWQGRDRLGWKVRQMMVEQHPGTKMPYLDEATFTLMCLSGDTWPKREHARL